MSRECLKCGSKIPNWFKIEGKLRNLQNRKFCLNCSPYKNHNTSPYDPVERVKRKVWSEFSEERKTRNKACLYYRGLRIRDELYQEHGGKCKICGYDKCKRALSFHHRDPSLKSFCLGLNNLWSKKRETIAEESAKCDLLCANCHCEVEDKISKGREENIIHMVNKYYGTNY